MALTSDVDREAEVRRLVDRASRTGYAIAFDLLGSRAEAEDAVQDALVRTLTGFARLRDPAALDAWFFRVLTNACIGVLRRRRVATAFASLFGMRGEPAQPMTCSGDHARLLAALDDMPAKQKTALVLRYGHDMSVAEIASAMAVGTETVKTHLKRGRAVLRERLGVDHE